MTRPAAATSHRSLVWAALSPSLDRLCASLGASGAVILLRTDPQGEWEVAATSEMYADRFQPNEPVRVSQSWSEATASIESMMVASSVLLESVVTCTFSDRDVHGQPLIAGTGGEREADPTGVVTDLREWRARAATIRHSDLEGAYKMVAEAATSTLSTERLIDVLLAGARQLLESDVAYLAMPVDDDVFAMSRTLGIRTEPFRHLRVAPKQGLGGAVRHEGAALRTLDYQADARLGPALRQVTRHEGIVSAMAAPVFDHDAIEALLYVGNRDLTAYCAEDQHLLSEFSEATRLALRQESLEVHRRHLVQREERERLARFLHDKLGRQLTQMAFATAAMRTEAEPTKFMQQLDAINSSIEACSGLLREEMDTLFSEASAPTHEPLRAVAESILEVPSVTGMERVTSYSSMDGSAVGDLLVQADMAEAIIEVGQEALFNAEHHSQGRTCRIQFDVQNAQLLVTISDDGRGSVPSPTVGHHGLRLMEESAARVGGLVEVGVSHEGGVRVTGSFPLPARGSYS